MCDRASASLAGAANARTGLQHDGVVAEGHAQLADGAVDVDAELVGQAQHLRCRGRA